MEGPGQTQKGVPLRTGVAGLEAWELVWNSLLEGGCLLAGVFIAADHASLLGNLIGISSLSGSWGWTPP